MNPILFVQKMQRAENLINITFFLKIFFGGPRSMLPSCNARNKDVALLLRENNLENEKKDVIFK